MGNRGNELLGFCQIDARWIPLTVAILAQGTGRTVAVTQAFLQVRGSEAGGWRGIWRVVSAVSVTAVTRTQSLQEAGWKKKQGKAREEEKELCSSGRL